jgi:3-hydroxyacyl-CoA dehydrogenase
LRRGASCRILPGGDKKRGARVTVTQKTIADGVAEVAFAGASGNRLTAALAGQIAAALDAAAGQPGLRRILLTGGPAAFSTGIDLDDLSDGVTPPAVAALAQHIAGLPVPVIAVIHGTALGAGAEIALACAARVGHPGARIGFPDIHLGRLPVAGATQRLPPLTGPAVALRILGRGQVMTADAAHAAGLLDAVAADPLAAAIALRDPERRSPAPVDLAGLATAAAAHRAAHPHDAAQDALADCIEAAPLLPRDRGLVFETTRAEDLAARPRTQALVRAMQGDRRLRAALPGGLPARHLGLWGQAAAPIAAQALGAGLTVTLGDPDAQALVGAMGAVGLALDAAVTAGRIDPALRDAAWSRLSPAVDPEGLAGADLVLDARGDAARAAVALPPAQGPLVLHAAAGPLAELQVAPGADRATAATLAATFRAMGQQVLPTGPGPTALATALTHAAAAAIAARVRTGATTAPAARAALAGHLDLPQAAFAVAGPPDASPGAPGDLRHDILLALAAEGLRALARGQAFEAQDIDIVARLTFAMPRGEAGPMARAEAAGLLILRRDLAARAAVDPVWAPEPMLDALVSRGGGFDRPA